MCVRARAASCAKVYDVRACMRASSKIQMFYQALSLRLHRAIDNRRKKALVLRYGEHRSENENVPRFPPIRVIVRTIRRAVKHSPAPPVDEIAEGQKR